MERPHFGVAFFLLCAALLAGCGGGSSAPALGTQILPRSLVSPAPAPGAAVEFLNGSGLTSSGTIVAGTKQAFVAVMSGDSVPASFAADSLTVSTPSTVQSVQRSASVRPALPAPRVPVEAFPAGGGRLFARLQSFRVAGSGRPARAVQGVLPSTLSVGTAAPIWVQRGSLSGSRVNVQVPATLVSQTAHANVWVDSTLQLSPSQIAQLDADVENAYASDTQHFASPDYPANAPGMRPAYTACGPGGAHQGTTAAYVPEPADRRIDVMVVNSSNLGGLGGYFSGANLMTQAALNCLNGSGTTYESNEAPFIFVGWFANNGAAYELQEDLVRSTAHELQHLINFVNHSILASGAASAGFDGNEQSYINEGLSMLAQDLAVANMYGSRGVHFDVDDALMRAGVYLTAPQNYSLSAFTGTDPASWGGDGAPHYNCGGGCYGEAYLFQRYLRDRFGGDAYTHAMETSGVTGEKNLEQATGESASSLFGDFALAMAADTLHVASGDPRFDFGTLDLSGSYRDQFGASTALGGVFAQPYSGSSLTLTVPVGGFAFVSMGSVPASGTGVSVSDQATAPGFALEGGLAQK